MGIRFSKSIKLGDLVKINLSKSGVSASIGKKGASVNIGKNGTYLNLSPAIAGISGTGVSYRKKLTGGYKNILNKVSKDKSKEQEINDNKNAQSETAKDYEVKEFDLNSVINIHKYVDDVLTKQQYENNINTYDNEATKEIYNLSLEGDEDTIESLVGSFLMNLDLEYPVKANYELEDHELYVDVDLPEIEQFKLETDKKVSNTKLKEYYGQSLLSLSIFLTANFFNLSSYIDTVIISGFTSKRNNIGDLVDEYIYSIKYLRSEFEKNTFKQTDDVYNFILNFENRINFNANNNSFKAIKPFEMKSEEIANSAIDEAIAALKQLGYKSEIVNEIIPQLKELNLNDSAEYLKEALKLISIK